MTSYDAVIFDKDGVLLDSGLDNFRWKDRNRVKKARENGIDLDIEDSVNLVQSHKLNKIENFVDNKNLSLRDLEEVEKSVQDTKIELIREGVIWMFPEAKKTLEEIDLPLALATNAPRRVTEFTLEYFDIKEYFVTVKSLSIEPIEEYFKHKKPHPDMIEEIIEENGFENPLMVGDTAADIEAAENAGIDSVQVLSYKDEGHPKATYQIRDLSELKHVLRDN